MGMPLSRNPDDADVFVLGLPYNLGTSGRAGTRSGPPAIRQISSNLRWEEKRWQIKLSRIVSISILLDFMIPKLKL